MADDPSAASIVRGEVVIPAEGASLPGSLTVPAAAAGVVAFAHGSGSSRFSPRNTRVAAVLHKARPEKTIVLEPDFEAVAGLRSHSHKPEAELRRDRASGGTVPPPLTTAVEWVLTLARD